MSAKKNARLIKSPAQQIGQFERIADELLDVHRTID
jgi:hypothetical protein